MRIIEIVVVGEYEYIVYCPNGAFYMTTYGTVLIHTDGREEKLVGNEDRPSISSSPSGRLPTDREKAKWEEFFGEHVQPWW